MPAFLTAQNLKPFISNELEVTSSQIEFQFKGRRAYGYLAELLPKVCDVFLEADKAQALTDAPAEIRAHVRALHDWQYSKDLAASLAAGPAQPGVVG